MGVKEKAVFSFISFHGEDRIIETFQHMEERAWNLEIKTETSKSLIEIKSIKEKKWAL